MVKYKWDPYYNNVETTIFENSSFVSNEYINKLNPFRFKGYYFDNETGLFYCNSRYYNPEWKRWLTPDTFEYLSAQSTNGLNLYTYCNNNPVMGYDPSGHLAISALIIWGTTAATYGASYGLGQINWGF